MKAENKEIFGKNAEMKALEDIETSSSCSFQSHHIQFSSTLKSVAPQFLYYTRVLSLFICMIEPPHLLVFTPQRDLP